MPHVQVPFSDPRALAACIDHTRLRPDTTHADVEALCAEAVTHGFATVCVTSVWAGLCARLLEGTPVGVCCVVAFPLGAVVPEVKVCETRRAIDDGAREVDVVMNLGAAKDGDWSAVLADLRLVMHECRARGALGKVIIETALFTDAEKVTACECAMAAGADFVKTSTGFAAAGATVGDVTLLRRVVGTRVGVKAAGGIRDLATARAMLVAGATRIGTSTGVAIVDDARGMGSS